MGSQRQRRRLLVHTIRSGVSNRMILAPKRRRHSFDLFLSETGLAPMMLRILPSLRSRGPATGQSVPKVSTHFQGLRPRNATPKGRTSGPDGSGFPDLLKKPAIQRPGRKPYSSRQDARAPCSQFECLAAMDSAFSSWGFA